MAARSKIDWPTAALLGALGILLWKQQMSRLTFFSKEGAK